jgi:hypothetical protein
VFLDYHSGFVWQSANIILNFSSLHTESFRFSLQCSGTGFQRRMFRILCFPNYLHRDTQCALHLELSPFVSYCSVWSFPTNGLLWNSVQLLLCCSSSSYFYQRLVGQSLWCLAPHLGLLTRFLLLSDICGLHVVVRSPWREDESVTYSFILLSLSCPSPAELSLHFTVSFETTGFPFCCISLYARMP